MQPFSDNLATIQNSALQCICFWNRALRLAYMQSGGSDPEVLAHMHDLQAEALTLEQAKHKAEGKTKERSE